MPVSGCSLTLTASGRLKLAPGQPADLVCNPTLLACSASFTNADAFGSSPRVVGKPYRLRWRPLLQAFLPARGVRVAGFSLAPVPVSVSTVFPGARCTGSVPRNQYPGCA